MLKFAAHAHTTCVCCVSMFQSNAESDNTMARRKSAHKLMPKSRAPFRTKSNSNLDSLRFRAEWHWGVAVLFLILFICLEEELAAWNLRAQLDVCQEGATELAVQGICLFRRRRQPVLHTK